MQINDQWWISSYEEMFLSSIIQFCVKSFINTNFQVSKRQHSLEFLCEDIKNIMRNQLFFFQSSLSLHDQFLKMSLELEFVLGRWDTVLSDFYIYINWSFPPKSYIWLNKKPEVQSVTPKQK